VLDDEEVRKIVEKYKQENGNYIKFTSKELLLALYEKVDSHIKSCSKIDAQHSKDIAYNRAMLVILWALMGGVILNLMF